MRTESFNDLLDALDAAYPNKTALIWQEEGKKKPDTMTFHALAEAVKKQTARMRMEPGKCVGICGAASPDWVVHMFASVCAGKQTVLLNPLVTKEELQAQAEATDMDSLWSDRAEMQTFFSLLRTNKETGDEKQETAKYPRKLLFFTSGTTERGKAVILSQKALLSSAWNGQQMMRCSEKDVLLSMLPLNHVFGFVCTLLWPLSQGAAVALGRGMRHFAEDPAYFHATILPVVPSLLRFLLKTNALNRELKGLLVGAGPCDLESLRQVWMRGIDIRFGYGLTETASGLAISLRGENPFSMALCPETEVTIGEDEQIYVRTTCMMDGYYHDPVHTAEKMTPQGFATGDIGYLDDKGHLHVRGRMDDVLVRANGEKIFLREWEADLQELLQTEGMICEQAGKLTLILSQEAGKIDENRKEEIFRKTDAYNKQQPIGRKIEQVLFYPGTFPKTLTGKLQRWRVEETLFGNLYREGKENAGIR